MLVFAERGEELQGAVRQGAPQEDRWTGLIGLCVITRKERGVVSPLDSFIVTCFARPFGRGSGIVASPFNKIYSYRVTFS